MDTNTYSEVCDVLDFLGSNYKNKIPHKLLNFFEKNKSKNYTSKLNNNSDLLNSLSRDTIILLSILHLKYWTENDEEKKYFKNMYNKNEINFQNKANQFKNKNWLN